MLSWLLGWLKGGAEETRPPQERLRASLVEERCRLAELLATYRDFGFEAQAQACRSQLREIQAKLQALGGGAGGPPAEPGTGVR